MKKHETIHITKASGNIVPFSDEKLVQSLKRAGASPELAQSILEGIAPELYEGISTKKIYRLAFKRLKKASKRAAGKYHLKQAIMELGPSGFPFEKFIGELLKHQGFRTQVGVIVEGHCVNHEIDVVAVKEDHHYMVECKYHNQRGISCDVKVPLYIYSRFKDVERKWLELPGHAAMFHQPWVVTNTKFTADAIQYGTCMGMKLIGWNYPPKDNLQRLVEGLNLYPVTCITSLTQYEKQFLLEKGIVLCKQMCSDERVLGQAGIAAARQQAILEEGKNLCEGNGSK